MTTVKIVLGRMDNNKVVDVEEYMSVGSALRQAGFTKADNEVIQNLEGEEFEMEDEIVSGGQYFLVSRVKSGALVTDSQSGY